MVTRRKFLGSLAGLTALTALAGAGIRLPKRVDTEMDGDFATENLYYKTTERWSNSNSFAAPLDFSETSLLDILNQLKDSELMRSYPGYLLKPKWLSPESV